MATFQPLVAVLCIKRVIIVGGFAVQQVTAVEVVRDAGYLNPAEAKTYGSWNGISMGLLIE